MTGSNNGGTAIVDFKTSIIGTTMYVTLDNLSPITLDSGSGDNAVGIVSFGFDLVDPNLVLNSWNFQAYYGSVLTDITSDWALVNKVGNLRLDLQASTQHNATLDGALYNPAWIANPNALPGGNHTSYFTSATMQLVFGGVPAIDDTSRYSPYVWVKNVGLSGDGSIKMTPEPWSLVLFGSGLLGFSFYHRRRTKFKS
jgi:hypothetical protein